MGKIILTGDRPTGKLHLGHFVGSLRNRVKLQNSNEFDEIYLMIADSQALTDNFDNPKKVRDNVLEVALFYLACGIDPKKTTIFIQSQVPALTELTFYYMNLVSVARLHRNPTVKQEVKLRGFEESIPSGFLNYPVSQAADITAFEGEIVPVGEDQLPLIEQCREIVRKFNNIYGETLREPEAIVSKNKRIKGLDGNEKMGKSLGNAIYLADSDEEITKKVMGAITDPKKLKKEDPADPNVCMVYYYHKLFENENIKVVHDECENGTRGCVACKKELINKIIESLSEYRKNKNYYEQNPEIVDEILKDGCNKAKNKAMEMTKKIKQNMKIDYFE